MNASSFESPVHVSVNSVNSANGDKASRHKPLEFYETIAANFQAATAKVGIITRDYRIAGHTVRLCFAGSTLVAPMTMALAHLAVPAVDAPELTLCLGEGLSTGIYPPTPWLPAEVNLRGEIAAFSDDQILTAIQRDGNAVSVLHRTKGVGFYWIDTPQALRAYERAAPLKILLHWWLREQGLPMIHAGAVGTKEGVALFVGPTGAGKSTTSLVCLMAGMHYISDDRCLLSLEPLPQAHCIYNAAKLHDAQMRRFPTLAAAVTNWHETATDKALLHVHEFAPQQLVHPLPIRVLLRANVVATETTSIVPVSRTQLLREFITSTLVYQPGAAQQETHMMAQLVQRVPCYQINLGSDFAAIPKVIAQAIRNAAQAS